MISKKFFSICQKGDEIELQNVLNQKNKYVDWTIYRHSASGDTGLHVAAQNGHLNIVKMLYNYSKNRHSVIDIMNFDSKRPLHDAAQFSRPDIVEFLIQKGALINTFKRGDWSPLMLACTKRGPEAKRCVQLLLEANADVFLKNKDGWTAFFITCRTGDYEIINLFLNQFGETCINDKSKNGRTALHILVFHGHTEIIHLLFNKYCSLLNEKDSVGYTPLLESIKKQNFSITKLLFDLGAKVSETDNAGRTVLHIACLCENIEVIKYILERNLIDAHVKDSFGNTVYNIAERNNLGNVIDVLHQYNVNF